MINEKLIDGVIIADFNGSMFTKNIINLFKLHVISLVGVVVFSPTYRLNDIIYWLDPEKDYIPYIETHIIDSCNLNCKGCGHFSPLFHDNEFYHIESFKRDIRALSKKVDIVNLRLMGGEPFKKADLDDYIEIARYYLPKTSIRVVTNGLLLPSVQESILSAIRNNRINVDISPYIPTIKIIDNIKDILNQHKIVYSFLYADARSNPIEYFMKALDLEGKNDMNKSHIMCASNNCRFLREGKLYKCPLSALLYRFVETFHVESLPKSDGIIDIYAQNFGSLVHILEGSIHLCKYCTDKPQKFAWKSPSKSKIEEWIINDI